MKSPHPSHDSGVADRKVTWLELFFDLVFVAAVAQVAAPLAQDFTPAGLLRFAFLFFLIWWAWNGHTNFATRFDTGRTVQRVLALVQIFVVGVMAANAGDGLDGRSSAGFAAAYAVLRLLLAAQYLNVCRDDRARPLAVRYALGFGLAAVCWLASAAVPAPGRYWLWCLALLVDVGTPVATAPLAARVPPHPAHLPERFGLFTIILLGESIVAVTTAMKGHDGWTVPAAMSAFLGMGISFLTWWWYFHGAKAADNRTVRTAAQARQFMIWNLAHLPLYLGIGVASVGVEHVIVHVHDAHVHAREAWILGGAAAIIMVAIATIASTTETHRPASRRPTLYRQLAVAAGPLLLAGASAYLPPVGVIAGLAALLLFQLVLAGSHEPQRGPAAAAGDSRVAAGA